MSGLNSSQFATPALDALIQSVQDSVTANDGDINSLNTQLSNLVLQVGSLSPDNVVEDAELTAQAVLDLLKTIDGAGSGLLAEVATYKQPADPTISETGVALHETWLNTVSGELFICTAVDNGSAWQGQLGTAVSPWDYMNDPALMFAHSMDNISGSQLIDEMGQYNGSIVGSVQVPGLDGNALSFDGENDYVTLSPYGDFKLSELTVALWFKVEPVRSSTGTLFDNNTRAGGSGSSVNSGVFLRVQPDADEIMTSYYLSSNETTTDELGYVNTSYTASTKTPFNQGQWNQLVYVQESAKKASVYLNGVRVNGVVSSQSLRFSSTDNWVGFGRYYKPGGTSFLDGEMENTRFFSRALSAEEVLALYQSEVPS